MLFPHSVELSYGVSSFISQCVVLQQLCFEWKPLILRKTQIRNDLILLLMDWLDYINTGITLSRKFLLPYCHPICHLGFASLIKEMFSISLPAEIAYHPWNFFSQISSESLWAWGCPWWTIFENWNKLFNIYGKIQTSWVCFIKLLRICQFHVLLFSRSALSDS